MRLRRPIAVLLLVTSWPTLAWGTTGVVTALEGTVTVARTAAAQPLPLRFKDEIRPFDRIATGDRSRARLLLAGAAAVTIGERSALTLTEVPGRSTVQLESGRIALAVARERLGPGETVVIRAPNATATLREGVVIAEVTWRNAQPGRGGPGPVTVFSVPRGVIEVLQLDPVTQAPLGPPVTVAARVRFTVAGGAPARVEAIPPEAMAEIASGLGRGRPQHTSPPNQDQLTAQAMATAVALATALVEPARAEPPSVAVMALDRYVLAGVTGVADVPLTPLMGADVFASPAGQAMQLDVPEIAISGASLTLPSGQTLKTFTGTVSWTSTAPVVAISDSVLAQTIDDRLIVIDTGASVSLGAPLLEVTNSTLSLGQGALFVLGALASTTTAPLISLDPTTVLTPGAPSSFVRVESGGSLSLAGPVLVDSGGTLTIGEDLLDVFGALTSTSPAPLLQFDGSTVTVGDPLSTEEAAHLIKVQRPSGIATLAGPILSATSSAVNMFGHALLEVFGGGVLSSTTPAPLIELNGGSLTWVTDDNSLIFFVNDATVNLAGPLMRATNVAVTTSAEVPFLILLGFSSLTVGGPLLDLVDTPLDLAGQPLVEIGGVSTLTTTAGPAFRVSGAALEARTLLSLDGSGNTVSLGGPLLELTNATLTVEESLLAVPSADRFSVTLGAGESFIRAASNASLNVGGGLLDIQEAQLTVTGSTDPLVSLSGGTHAIATATGSAMFNLRGVATATEVVDGVTLTLGTDAPLVHGGVLLEASGATVTGEKVLKLDTALLAASAPLLSLTAGSTLTTTLDALDLSQRAKLTSVGPLLKLDASTLAVLGGALINLAGGSFLSVIGNLLTLTNGSTLNLASLSSGFLVTVSGGSVLNVTGALVQFVGPATNSIVVGNSAAPTTVVTVGGVSIPILLTNGATASQVTITGTPVQGTTAGTITFPNSGSLIKIDGPTAKVTISGG